MAGRGGTRCPSGFSWMHISSGRSCLVFSFGEKDYF
ncbi:hypothetical protein E2320_013859 [Naja naja]|nr:hypothetical protein E2320_013859 [Naja naja]